MFKFNSKKPKASGKKSGALRMLLAFFFLALSVALAFFALPALYEDREATDTVFVATAHIRAGDTIHVSHIEERIIGVYGFSGYARNITDIVGMIALADIFEGDVFMENRIGEADGNEILSLAQEGRGLLTITVRSNAAGLASHLISGARVRVYNIKETETAAPDPWGGSPALQPQMTVTLDPLLSDIEIFSIENAAAMPVSDINDSANPEDIQIVSTVTFFTTSVEQEKALLLAEYDGTVHLALIER